MPPGLGEILAESGDLTFRRLRRASEWRRVHGGTIDRALLDAMLTGLPPNQWSINLPTARIRLEHLLTLLVKVAVSTPGAPPRRVCARARAVVPALRTPMRA